MEKQAFINHKRKHSSKKPYKCDVCDFVYTTREYIMVRNFRYVMVVNMQLQRICFYTEASSLLTQENIYWCETLDM